MAISGGATIESSEEIIEMFKGMVEKISVA
jgi:hypothetical protein